jgi:hypothetical protein
MTTVSDKSWKDNLVEFFTSPSGMMSTISGVGLIITAIVLSKLGEPSVFDDNLYKDRLRRSTIQLLILSVLGFVLGIYLKRSDLDISSLNIGTRQSMTTILAIGILMMAVTADMVNSFRNIAEVDSLVKGLVATMLTVSIIVVIYAIYKLTATTERYQQWRSGSSGLATPSESATETVGQSLSLHNFIMF